MSKGTLIDNQTGEIISENFVFDTLEDKQRKVRSIKKTKATNDFKELQKEYLGNFIFFIYEHMQELQKILNDIELVKFIFIGTFVHDNGALMLDNNITYINKKTMKQLLGLADKSFYKLFNKLINNKLLSINEDKIYINPNYVWKGSFIKYKELTNKKIKNFTRIYIQTIRDLYMNTPVKSHKKIAIIYKLLPYINYEYNILCFNPDEKDGTKLEAMTIKDVLIILGYDKSHLARFKKDFYSQRYKEYYVFITIQKESEYLTSLIVVNPIFFYKGINVENLNWLLTLFNLNS